MEYILPVCALTMLTIAVFKSKCYLERNRKERIVSNLALTARVVLVLVMILQLKQQETLPQLAVMIGGLVVAVGMNETESFIRSRYQKRMKAMKRHSAPQSSPS